MSRAARRYKRWERDTQAGAWESARELALDLYYCRVRAINLADGTVMEPAGEDPQVPHPQGNGGDRGLVAARSTDGVDWVGTLKGGQRKRLEREGERLGEGAPGIAANSGVRLPARSLPASSLPSGWPATASSLARPTPNIAAPTRSSDERPNDSGSSGPRKPVGTTSGG